MRNKIGTLNPKWIALISIILVAALWATVSVTIKRNKERTHCEEIAKMAETAFSRGDFYEAEKYYTELEYGSLDRDYFDTCPNRPVTSTGIPLDPIRLGELQSYNRAAREKEGGDYYGAVQTLQIYLEHPGELKGEAESLQKGIYQALTTDTGQFGARLLLDMYEVGCGLGENNLPPLASMVSGDTEYKYWYPGAIALDGNHAASMPAEFQIAVCYKTIETSIAETCVYTQTGTAAGSGLASSTVRKNATYEIELKNILTGETIATYQPVYSKPPAACPQTMSGTTLFNEIIGEPDLSAAITWIEEQVSTLK